MGVIKRGILGGFSGSVGNIVGSSWKGIDVMKTKPLSVANPQTAGQVNQRNKFSGAVEIASALLANIVKPLWDRFAQRQSGYNAFVSANIPNIDNSGDPVAADIITSQGSLTAFDTFNAAEGFDAQTVDCSWVDNSGTGTALATDDFYLAVYNATQDIWEGFATSDTRTDAASSVTLSHTPASSDVMHVYASFRRADGTLVCDSQYDTYTIA